MSEIVNFKQGKNQLTYKEALAGLDELLSAFDRTVALPDIELCDYFCPLILGVDAFYTTVGQIVKQHLLVVKEAYIELKQRIVEEPEEYGTQLQLLRPICEILRGHNSLNALNGLRIVTPLEQNVQTLSVVQLHGLREGLYISSVYLDFHSLWVSAINLVFDKHKLPDEEPQHVFYDPFQKRIAAAVEQNH